MNSYLKTLFVLTMMLVCVNGWAEDLVYGKEYTAISSLSEWAYSNISGSCIISDAKSIKIKVYNTTYVKIVNGNTTIKEFSWNSDNQAGVSVDISGTNLDVAKTGGLDAWAGGFAGTAYLTITNYDTEDGASTDTGSSSSGNDSGDGTSGSDTGTGGSSTNTNNLATKIANREQLTNLPTVYFTVPDAEGKAINDVLFKDRTNNIADYHQTTIQVVDNSTSADGRPIGSFTEDSLYIKVRGNSTAEMDKRPYRLKFCKDEKSASGDVTKSYKHDLLGYGYSKRNWAILNNMRDGTLMQNAITYYIGQALGMPFCPGYKFVDLVINDEYRGNYMLTDHVEVGKNRIEVDEDTGWFIESTRNDMVEEPYVYAGAMYVLLKNPESDTDEGTTALKDEVKKYLDNINSSYFGIWASCCDDATFCDPQKGWRSVLDEETLVKMYLGINLTGDFDGFMQVKMYREADGKLFFGPLWDKDLAFGVQGTDNTLVEGNSYGFGAPLFANYMNKLINKDPVFAKKVHDKLHDMVDNGYVDNINAEIDKLQTMLTESKTLEYNNTDWKAVSVSGYPEAVTKLKTYIAEHTAWLVETIDAKYETLGGSSIVDNTICTEHDYTVYNVQGDGTYHQACSKCGVENNTDTYYKFTVYPESATTETVYAKSWTPSTDHPNSIASVKITAGLEANIPDSYNVYNTNENADGDLICPDFRLTDGHPYYSAKKFVATKATYTRELGANEEYGTIILPYKYQIASNDYASFYHIDKISENKMILKAIDPDTDGDASAYTPVVFKRKNGTTTLKVDGTNITVKKSSADKTKSTADGWTLTGVMESTTVSSGGSLYQISDAQNGVISPVSSVTVNPFRAYFLSTSGATSTYTFSVDGSNLTGDANGDGKLDVNDVTALSDYIIGKAPSGFNASDADVNHDGEVNIIDVSLLVKAINEK